ncbi:MAG: YihY/virulence factor BrkB family protein [Bacteroides sp.]|nr:YihY/virulence factor BrkB family protein [Prevotella sp.]MCM1408047.1 YihY/virulence factor BrkB family protein [Treponema brennaborense]MCM1469023.1 YihY/virulence factor BrkB family protein [Bacteroides sp.]
MFQKKNPENQAKKTALTTIQILYLTFMFFFQNNLFMYASSCALGFLFSAVPFLILIIAFVIRFWHTAPEAIMQFYDFDIIFDTRQLHDLIETLFTVQKAGLFEVLIMVSVFWMAQRFFFSIMKSIRFIFHDKVERRPLVENVFIFAGEAILVLGTGTVIFLFITIRSLFSDFFAGKFGILFIPAFMQLLIKLAPYALLFFILMLAFRFAPRTKPDIGLCALSALCTTGSFFLVQKFFDLFLNAARYNLIYGVLGNLIIILLELCIFFYLFLFFAQYIFIRQFFDSLLLSELYLLPDREETKLLAVSQRLLFIRPDRFLISGAYGNCSSVSLDAGKFLYTPGDASTGIYYIISGAVEIISITNCAYKDTGASFGEEECILHTRRTSSVHAIQKTQLLHIPCNMFYQLMQTNPSAAQKAMTIIMRYFAGIYGRK